MAEAAFPVFLPEGMQSNESSVMYYVEKDGQKSPVLAFRLAEEITILEGTYLPKYDANRIALDERTVGKPEDIEIDGLPAIIQIGNYGRGAVILVKDGTTIEISGKMDNEKAVQLVRGLKQVRSNKGD